ncbi:MAG: DUF3179 domain-containing protein [Reichenbachiella sp.]
MMNNFLTLFIAAFVFISCAKEKDPIIGNPGLAAQGEWSIPLNRILDGGPGKDGIPALDEPIFVSPQEATYLDDDELVIGHSSAQESKAYSHLVMNWHEIANDWFGQEPVAVIYCPLTGTATGWHRKLNNQVTTFGVSGLLYNANVIPYDRNTDSNWSQLTLECVNGELIGTRPEMVNLLETSWSTWKTFFPDTEVLSTETGFDRSYGVYPYGSYRTSEGLIFQVKDSDDRLHPKERVHSIISGDYVKAYRFSNFPETAAGIILDNVEGQNVVVIGSQTQNFIVSFFEKQINDEVLTFSLPSDDLYTNGNFTSSVILTDQFGNNWNAFGYAVTGPNEGDQLTPTMGIMGYWFPWTSFYTTVDIYGEQ